MALRLPEVWGFARVFQLNLPLILPLSTSYRLSGGVAVRRLILSHAILPAGVPPAPHESLSLCHSSLEQCAFTAVYARYERAHRARLAAIFIPKFPRVPAEIIPTIIAFWADCGGH